jgi:hypothetical protein
MQSAQYGALVFINVMACRGNRLDNFIGGLEIHVGIWCCFLRAAQVLLATIACEDINQSSSLESGEIG